jgi:hypothetical protein
VGGNSWALHDNFGKANQRAKDLQASVPMALSAPEARHGIRTSTRRLVKALAAKTKHAVGSRPVIFPGDSCGQFDQLRRGKPLLQALPQVRRYFCRRSGNCISQFQYQLFLGTKQIAFGIPVQVLDLLVTDACASAPGRVDVDSKRAFHQFGRAYLRQHFQFRRHQIGFVQRQAELGVSDKNIRMAGHCVQRRNIFAQPFSGQLADQRYF